MDAVDGSGKANADVVIPNHANGVQTHAARCSFPSSSVSFLINQRDDLYDTDDDTIPEINDPLCPVITLTAEEKRRIRRPWADALIVNMLELDKDPGYYKMKKKLEQKWQPKGQLKLPDVGNGHYVAKFSNPDDRNRVLTEGPWMIDDNYLMVRRWVANFDPFVGKNAQVLTAWIRVLGLSMEGFDEGFLRRVGRLVGTVVKVDERIMDANGGRFVRLAVEVGLGGSLPGKLRFRGKEWKIQYEAVREMCYECGKIGQVRKKCQKIGSVHKKTSAAY